MIAAPVAPDAQEMPAVLAALARVAHGGHYVLGAEVAAFEAAWASACGARHCVGVASGTDALKLLLSGLSGRVLVPANTAPPTYIAIREAGLVPWFVDVGADGLIDPEALPEYPHNACALLPVHLYGRVVRMAPLAAYAAQHGLRLVEDACQAHGARDPDGHHPGFLSYGAAYSFYPTKNLAALGDAGAVVTNDDAVAELARCLRFYGYVSGAPGRLGDTPGVNSRLDELQAAVLRARLPHLERRNAQRRAAVAVYRPLLAELGLDVYVGANTNYHLLVVRVPRRDAVRRVLAAHGVATAVHYPVPGHRQTPFLSNLYLPRAEAWCDDILTLPLWPGMDGSDIARVVMALRIALKEPA